VRDVGQRRFSLQLGIIAIVALAIRVAYVQLYSRHADLGFDANTYYEIAKRIAAGHLPGALFPPGLPFLLAVFRLIGLTTRTKELIGMAVLGTSTTVLIGVVGRRLGGARVGLVAAGLAAVYPNLWLADGALMTESLTAFVVVAMIWLLLRAQSSPTNKRWLLVGVPAAVAALTRSDGWLFILAMTFTAALLCRALPRRRQLACAALALVLPIGFVAAWEIRNVAQMHALLPIAVNSWDVVGGANCYDTYYGDRIGSWVTQCLQYGGRRDEISANRYARDLGIDYARAHAARIPLVVAARLGRTFGVYEPWQELDVESFFEGRSLPWSKVGFVMYALLVPFAAAGALVLRRRHDRASLGILLVPVATVFVSTVFGYGNHRFRIPMEPTLLLLAAVAICNVNSRRSTVAARDESG
jgi:4-amino-4-deoxy-L-arabinose transferase-like glycosyltransferase